MSFNHKECKRLLLESPRWNTIEEIWQRVKSTEGIVDEDFIESALDKAGKAELRSVLNEEDPATGLPIGVSIIGEDGERRYKPTQLFDDSDYKKARDYHYGRMVHHGRMVRKFEHHGGLEQLSLDLTWLDEQAEDAA